LRRPRFLFLGRRCLRALRLPGRRLPLRGWSLRSLRLPGGRLSLRGRRLRLTLRGRRLALLRLLLGSRRLLFWLAFRGLPILVGRLGCGRRLGQDQRFAGQRL
jgi:hypothetical protein